MANNLNLQTLTPYVDQSHDDLILKAVLGSKSVDNYQVMLGVKGPTTINLLDVNPTFQNGATCGFNPQGSVDVTQRTITPAILKINMSICEKTLLGHYEQHLIKVGAGKETLPWEAAICNQLIDRVNEGVEKMLYNGDKTGGVEFDGLLTILAAESSVIKPTLTGTTAWDKIAEVYAAMPEEVLNRPDKFIGVSATVYRAFVQSLVASNLYHYDANDSKGKVYLPGTDCEVRLIPGLDSTKAYDIIATYDANIYVGTDMKNDEERFTVKYNDRDEVWDIKIAFSMGVNVAFPDYTVIAKL